jgi:hypothetical protein
MKLALSNLSGKFSAQEPPPPFLPVLEWISWLEESIKRPQSGIAGEFRAEALGLVEQMEMESARWLSYHRGGARLCPVAKP